MMVIRLNNPGVAALIAAPARESMADLRITTSFYMNEVPPFAGAELERLYGSVYASLAQFRIYDHGGPASTYVARLGNSPLAVLLFRIDGFALRVLNEVIAIDVAEIDRFARFAFASFPAVQVIRFHAVRCAPQKPAFPSQRYNCLEDIVLALPPTEQAYFSSLGKNTRRNLKRYERKLRAAHPDFRFDILDGDDVSEQLVQDIVALNRARMAGKNKASSFNEVSTGNLTSLVHDCGLVGIGTIGGKACAGAIAFRAGDNYFLSVIAHDPRYDEYWLGILCCYMTICASIARGGREFHFLWGEYAYKYTLQGVKQELDNLVLYRSPLQMLRHADVALDTVWLGLARRMHLWMHGLSHSDQPFPLWLRKAVQRMRGVRDMWQPKEP